MTASLRNVGSLRSEGDEALEALLRFTIATFEEGKLPYLAHLYTRIAYDQRISGSEANFLLRTAGGLSLRQLALLALEAAREREHRSGGGEGRSVSEQEISTLLSDKGSNSDPTVLAENTAMVDLQLLSQSESSGWPSLTPLGRLLVDAMQLESLPQRELEALIESVGPTLALLRFGPEVRAVTEAITARDHQEPL
jgi:hypothetical protein